EWISTATVTNLPSTRWFAFQGKGRHSAPRRPVGEGAAQEFDHCAGGAEDVGCEESDGASVELVVLGRPFPVEVQYAILTVHVHTEDGTQRSDLVEVSLPFEQRHLCEANREVQAAGAQVVEDMPEDFTVPVDKILPFEHSAQH
uniref:Uncharacterized protein n=1 Tax=Erpetoichthys calabaricus TaxID=27687 RepID=A0A8C4SBZ4_ERPCA